MNRAELFPGEKVLSRAISRYRTGIRKPFEFLGRNWILTDGYSDDKEMTSTFVRSYDGWKTSTEPLRTLDADGLHVAINNVCIRDVMES